MSNRRRTHVRKSAAALAGAAALMALLTACNGTATGSVTTTDGGTAAPAAGDSTGGSGSTGSAAPSNGGTGSGSSGSNGSGNTSGSSTSGGSSSGGSSSGGTAAGSSVPACKAGDLDYSWPVGDPSAGQQQSVAIALTNKSGHTCTMYGFPGVDLVNSGTQWSLQRTNATPQRVTLANGAAAHFVITYLKSDDAGTAFRPSTVVITAPNQRTSYDIPWQGGPIVLQDGATHPGTYVGPVGK
ncbi:DUF4232 domain-containing protein [Streptomyces sp. NPDC048277]|uniref:DUF4232 domain-containing protein n=1 Tax=Streptomyces sp. NPDC048277 TaxID=3155027 RepID=UPI0033F0D31D